jgi:type III restriction enzyme
VSKSPEQVPIQPVDQPIICSPFDEPDYHWSYDKTNGQAIKTKGRRPAGYWYKTEGVGTKEQSLFAELEPEENFDDLPLVNLLREDVRRWRESDYRGTTNVSRELLRWWANPNRSRPLFFCQREAVETLIYLMELRLPRKASRTGFRKFALSDDNLERLIKGERPQPEGEVELDYADGKKKHVRPFQDLASATFYPTLADIPLDPSLRALERMGCKMATGSGKTVVMALLISWAFCNRGVNPNSKEFPNAVLVCCPNLTVKERLQVLRPEVPGNYFTEFDIVPVNLRPHLQTGRVLVENWHSFAQESEHREGGKSYAVVDKGPETPETLARRVLGELYDRLPIMVLNDEGHHCWRPARPDVATEEVDTARKGRRKSDLSSEETKELKEEANEARVWLQGLDWINNCLDGAARGILHCIDLSATPFYIKGSGFSEGQPFPWLVSDFGLVDAIESGIVKIPRLPVRDTAGKRDEAGRPDPKYFRLWRKINEALHPHEKFGSGKPKPEPCYREAHGALTQIAGQWLERFRYVQAANPDQERVPPVLIIVCDNTEIADYFYRKISGETESEEVTPEDVEDVENEEEPGDDEPKRKTKPKKKTVYGPSAVLQEFANTPERKVTIRIDVKVLREAESESTQNSKQKAAEALRKVVATVGKAGEPGEHVRCVVSVAMLTEGWDANNVTHVLGVRAFGSQLLCEQVVGRGLRRMNYTPEKDESGKLLLRPEYVDVYGIPFSVIPFKGRPVDKAEPDDKPNNRVWAVPDRDALEIRFPIVEGYVFEMTRGLLRCNVDEIETLSIRPRLEPTMTYLRPAAGYLDAHRLDEQQFEFTPQDRTGYYAQTHLQMILFQITHQIIDDLQGPTKARDDKRARVMRLQSRHHLFPQVYQFVQRFARERINYNGVDPRELGLEKYARLAVERVRDAIHPDDSQGEPPLLPILNRYRPTGSTAGVDFVTKRSVVSSAKSHINAVVLHSGWEAAAARLLEAPEASEIVEAYARNDHLGLVIPYEYFEVEHSYEPDFLVRLLGGTNVLVEVKGYEVHDPEKTNAKHQAARKWVTAVNNLSEFGKWDFLVSRDLELLLPCFWKLVGKDIEVKSLKTAGELL